MHETRLIFLIRRTTITGKDGEEKFVCGVMIDVGGDKSTFVPGQLIGKGVTTSGVEEDGEDEETLKQKHREKRHKEKKKTKRGLLHPKLIFKTKVLIDS